MASPLKAYVLSSFLLIFASLAWAGNQTADVQKAFAAGGVESVATWAEAEANPVKANERYDEAIKFIYWKKKNVSAGISLAQRAAEFSETKWRACKKSGDLANKLRAWQKTHLYNLASFAWPGWNDTERPVNAAQRKFGYLAAKQNLKLAIELKKPALKIGMAHWLVGAHELTAGEYKPAANSFVAYRGLANRANNNEHAVLADGYLAIAGLQTGAEHAEIEFSRAVEGLEKLDTKDAKFFAQQLRDIRSFMTKKMGNP